MSRTASSYGSGRRSSTAHAPPKRSCSTRKELERLEAAASTPTCFVTVDRGHRAAGTGDVGLVTQADRTALPFDPYRIRSPMLCGPEDHDDPHAAKNPSPETRPRSQPSDVYMSMERNMSSAASGTADTARSARHFICKDGPGRHVRRRCADGARDGGAMCHRHDRPTVAVWKFASCDGCQLTMLDCEDEFLAIVDAIDIAYFPEATRAEVRRDPTTCRSSKGRSRPSTTPNGSTTSGASRRTLITIGACATAGGIQSLKNWATSMSSPDRLRPPGVHPVTLDDRPRSATHVSVDFELRGCPISKHQLIDVIDAFVHGRKPTHPPGHRVRRMQAQEAPPCVMVPTAPRAWAP